MTHQLNVGRRTYGPSLGDLPPERPVPSGRRHKRAGIRAVDAAFLLALALSLLLGMPGIATRWSTAALDANGVVHTLANAKPLVPLKQLPFPRPQTAQTLVSQEEGLIAHGPRRAREVALTFDADMTPGMLLRLRAHAVSSWYDRSITTYLERTGTPATIFITGLWAKAYSPVIRTLRRNPLFELENHSYEHYAFAEPCWGLPPVGSMKAMRRDIVAARDALISAGAPPPHYFRFPGGCHTAATIGLVRSLGEKPVNWDVVSNDAFQPNSKVVVHSVLHGVRPGSIVIMHLIGAPNAPATSKALRTIVPQLRQRGYRFVTLRELLGG